MREDVYNKITDICELAINTVGKAKSQTELSFTMIATLTGIMGVCSGAKAMEKEENK